MSVRLTRLVGIWALAAATLVVGFPRSASACSCAADLPSEIIAGADLVFVGAPSASQTTFDGERIETLFLADAVIKGEVGASVVLSHRVGSGCGEFPTDGTSIGVAAIEVSGDVLGELCSVMDAEQLLAAAGQQGLEIMEPTPTPEPAEMPESTSTYAAAIPLSVGLSLVFLAAVALGTRTSTLSR